MPNSENSPTKIKTYVGFARKAGKVVMGVDNIVVLKRPVLVLYSKELAENSVKKLEKASQTTGHTLIALEPTTDLGLPDGCKAIGVKEKNLADAIIRQLNN